MAQYDLKANSEPDRPREPLRLVFEKFQGFVDEYRPKISLGGMFLETEQTKPVGTPVACEFKLADGFRLCQALGEVLWVRPRAYGPDLPAGMGIRFQALDDQGRELILRILEEQVRNGGQPFEVERVPPDAASPVPAPRDDPPPTLAPRPRAPAPREDPASTHAREAVQLMSAAAAAAAPQPEASDEPASPEQPLLPSFELAEDLGSPESAEADEIADAAESPAVEHGAETPDFKAPWGQELPEIPEEVIEPIDEETALASAEADFSSDPGEAGFPADLLDVMPSDSELAPAEPVTSEFGVAAATTPEAPDEISFADDELEHPSPLPDFDTPLQPELDASETPEFDVLEESADIVPPPVAEPDEDRHPEPEPDLVEADAPPAAPVTGPPAAAAPVTAAPASKPEFVPPPSPLEAPGPAGGFDQSAGGPAEEGITDFGLPRIADPAAPSSDSTGPPPLNEALTDDEEWQDQEPESGLRRSLRNLWLSLAEAKGLLLTVVLLAAVVGGALIFKETILGWIGLGSPAAQDLPVAQDVSAASPAEDSPGSGLAETGSPAPAGVGETPSEARTDEAAGAAEPPPARTATEPEVISVDAEPPPAAEPPTPAPSARTEPPPPLPVEPPEDPVGRPAAAPAPGDRPSGAAAAAQASKVHEITYDQIAEGTRVTIRLDGSLSEDRHAHHTLGYDPLKEQIVIRGIATPFRSKIDVGTLELDRIRTGLHGKELKLVFDLSSELMTIGEIRSQDDRLILLVRRR